MTNNLHKIPTQGAITTITSSNYIGKAGELTLDTQTGIISFHDGTTPGGSPIGGSGGGSSVGSAGTVQMSDGSGGFVVSDFVDNLTVPGIVTAKLKDAVGILLALEETYGAQISGTAISALALGPDPSSGNSGAGWLEVDGVESSPVINMLRANGVANALTAALSGDVLAQLLVLGWTGTSVAQGGSLNFNAESDFSGAPTSSISLLNASGLGLHIAADGTFSTDIPISPPPGASILIASAIGVDLNTTGDTRMTLSAFATGKFFVVDYGIATNPSISLDTANIGLWSGADATGEEYCAPIALAALVNPADWAALRGPANLPVNGGQGTMQITAPIVNVNTPQGSAATADFYVYGKVFT